MFYIIIVILPLSTWNCHIRGGQDCHIRSGSSEQDFVNIPACLGLAENCHFAVTESGPGSVAATVMMAKTRGSEINNIEPSILCHLLLGNSAAADINSNFWFPELQSSIITTPLPLGLWNAITSTVGTDRVSKPPPSLFSVSLRFFKAKYLLVRIVVKFVQL